MNQRQIELPQEIDLQELFGSFDSNLKLLEKGLYSRVLINAKWAGFETV